MSAVTAQGSVNEQRMRSLQMANDYRSRRREMKLLLKSMTPVQARREALGLLAQPPAYTRTMRVDELLRALPGIRSVKASRILRRSRVAPSTELQRLTVTQRVRMAPLVMEWTGR